MRLTFSRTIAANRVRLECGIERRSQLRTDAHSKRISSLRTVHCSCEWHQIELEITSMHSIYKLFLWHESSDSQLKVITFNQNRSLSRERWQIELNDNHSELFVLMVSLPNLFRFSIESCNFQLESQPFSRTVANLTWKDHSELNLFPVSPLCVLSYPIWSCNFQLKSYPISRAAINRI